MSVDGAAAAAPGLRAPWGRLNIEINRGRVILLVLFLSALSASVATWTAASTFAHDDVFISFRYMNNLLASGDLSWNPGDRVEGYTNFLDLLIVSGLVKLGAEPLAAARGLHFAALLALTAIAVWRAASLAAPGKRLEAGGYALIALMVTNAIPVWLFGGLETMLATAFITAGAALLAPVFLGRGRTLRDCGIAGLMFALGVLTRPDAVVMLAAAGLSILAFAPLSWRGRILAGLALGAAPVLFIGAHEAFRIAYYGDWLPNTFWAKSGAPLSMQLGFAWEYIQKSIPHVGALLVFFGLVAMALRKQSGAAMLPYAGFLAAACGMQVLYIVVVGGDHMQAARFFVPCMGIAAIGVGVLGAQTSGLRNLALAAGLAASAWGSTSQADTGGLTDPAREMGNRVGEWIDKRWPAGSLVALHTAGSTPWAAPDLRYIDMLGLNDRDLAHDKPSAQQIADAPRSMPGHLRGSAAYVLSREPDYIILGPAEGVPMDDPWFITDVELGRSAEFHRCYAMFQSVVPRTADGRYVAHRFTYYQRTCAKTR